MTTQLYEEMFNAKDKHEFVNIVMHDAPSLPLYVDRMAGYSKWLKSHNKSYVYLVTFTLKKEIWDKPDQIQKARELAMNIQSRAGLNIHKCEVREEKTKNGVPHWHASVLSRDPIYSNRFKYYVQHYGNVDVSKTKSKSMTTAQAYQYALDYTTKED